MTIIVFYFKSLLVHDILSHAVTSFKSLFIGSNTCFALEISPFELITFVIICYLVSIHFPGYLWQPEAAGWEFKRDASVDFRLTWKMPRVLWRTHCNFFLKK